MGSKTIIFYTCFFLKHNLADEFNVLFLLINWNKNIAIITIPTFFHTWDIFIEYKFECLIRFPVLILKGIKTLFGICTIGYTSWVVLSVDAHPVKLKMGLNDASNIFKKS